MRLGLRLFVVLGCLMLLVGVRPGSAFQASDPAQELLERMTPAERVGQLFLVTFEGSEITPGSPIDRLIRDGRIGGVVLRKANDNLTAGEGAWGRVAGLTSGLQAIALGEAAGTPEPEGTPSDDATRVPLWIGISPGADGTLSSELLGIAGESATPMSLGAAWDLDLARGAGREAGRELAALGVNLILGPSLDILENVQTGGSDPLGVQSFGGDPFWVGRVGRAYQAGLREGSDGKLAIVATHFPGMGNADRPADEEVATVRKSLDQLRQTELTPFMAAAAPPVDATDRGVDGLLVSHIRYQGLQGNIRETTRPVSLDRDALSQVVAIEPIAEWRQVGGLMVSESLGSRAVRRFVDPKEQTYNSVVVARTAFQAGMDLLFLEDFQNPEDPDELTSILKTLRSFADKYEDDPVFAEQVDVAVLRLLRKKLGLYGGSFGAESVVAAMPEQPAAPDPSPVVRRAATLISPSAEEVRERLEIPSTGDRIVIFTDARPDQACSKCPIEPSLAREAFAQSLNSLYGTASGGQVRSWDVVSLTLADLAAYLGEKPPTTPAEPLRSADDVGEAISRADWMIFLVQRPSVEVFGSDGLQLLLARRPDLLTGKSTVVFAMDVPYVLDSTDISKVDAIYGLYGHTDAYVDTAARILFREVEAEGSSPVSIPGVGYDLLTVLSPDPAQLIRLALRAPESADGSATAEPGFTSGDEIVLEAGPVLDWNGNRVPDGTPVEFLLQYQDETIPSAVESTTQGGIATATVLLDRIGMLSVQARSEPARSSEIVQLNVQEGTPAFVTVIAPTAVPTVTRPPAEGGTSAPPTASDTGSGTLDPARPPSAGLDSFLAAVLGCAAVAFGAWRWLRSRLPTAVTSARITMVALIGGMGAYAYLALRLPGSPGATGGEGVFWSFLAATLGAAVGVLLLWGSNATRWKRAQVLERAEGSSPDQEA